MKEKKIHLIGICGVAMGSLAQMFAESGYSVTGSDMNMYPPMSTILQESGITLYDFFDEEHVKHCDLVIIGNAISRGNSEVEYVLNNKMRYISMAQALYSYFLNDRIVIAVAGTHGKTTTSGLLSHILTVADPNTSFFVGGVLTDYHTNYKLGKGRYAVIEADEYDSAFFEKVPKFMFYKPDRLVITSLEYDHADIYRSLEEIEVWFKRLVNIVPSGGTILYSNDYPNLKNVVADGFAPLKSFGEKDADISYVLNGVNEQFAELTVSTPLTGITVETQLLGEFNFKNVAAAVGMALELGISHNHIQNGVKSFTGIKRRQELIYSHDNISVYEDFAHHPTAIKYVIDAFRGRFENACLWVLYEPRSATSRRNVFQDLLPASFGKADHVVIKTPFSFAKISNSERLDVPGLVNDINRSGNRCVNYDYVEDIVTYVIEHISYKKINVILVLSNGSFDGIYMQLIAKIKSMQNVQVV